MNRGNLVVKWVGPVCWTLLIRVGNILNSPWIWPWHHSDLCVWNKFFVQVKCVKNYPKWWQATPNSIHQLAIMVLLQVAIDKITKILVAMSNAKKEIDRNLFPVRQNCIHRIHTDSADWKLRTWSSSLENLKMKEHFQHVVA